MAKLAIDSKLATDSQVKICLEAIATAAEGDARPALIDVLIVHRHGRLSPGEPIVLVATAAAHRRAAFEAADFLMDPLKTAAPFWKKETGQAGTSWVAAKDEDEAALDRW